MPVNVPNHPLDEGRSTSIHVPAARTRALVNLWLVVHFGLLLISLSTLVGYTALQGRLVEFSVPYLTPLHLRMDGRRLDYVRFDEGDREHRIQWALGGSWEDTAKLQWHDDDLAGSRISGVRSSRFAAAIAEAVAGEDTATAMMLLVPWLNTNLSSSVSPGSEPPMDQSNGGLRYLVRVIALPIAGAEGEGSQPVVRLRAEVLATPNEQNGGPKWTLVTVKESRLNATAVGEPGRVLGEQSEPSDE